MNRLLDEEKSAQVLARARALMAKQEISEAALARQIGRSQSQVNRVFGSRRPLTVDMALRIGQVLEQEGDGDRRPSFENILGITLNRREMVGLAGAAAVSVTQEQAEPTESAARPAPPPNSKELFREAEQLAARQQWDAADAKIQAAIAQHPVGSDEWATYTLWRALWREQRGEAEQAEDLIAVALQTHGQANAELPPGIMALAANRLVLTPMRS